MIYLGPGGVPICATERSSAGGVRKVREIGLNAMEVEFVRGVKMGAATAKELGEVAREAGVWLSVHAPYYVNLTSEKAAIVKASKQRILESAERAEEMGADSVAIHAAYYGGRPAEEIQGAVYSALLDVLDEMKSSGVHKTVLGVETMAKLGQWGTLDEALALHKKDKRIVPYIDWCHIWARDNGAINYGEILDRLHRAGIHHINSHFSCSKFNAKNKKWQDVHVPMSAGSRPDFGPLAKELVKRKADITIISESPVLEQDSLKMKEMLKRAGYKWPERDGE